LVKADFGNITVLTSTTAGTQSYNRVRDGQLNFVDGAEARFVVVLRNEIRNLGGRLELRFTLDGCAGVPPWDMFLVISNGKLEPDASDYDGDGRSNFDERRIFVWDPAR